MNPLLKSGEIQYFYEDSGARFSFVWPDFADEAGKAAAETGTRLVVCGPMGPADGSSTPPSRQLPRCSSRPRARTTTPR